MFRKYFVIFWIVNIEYLIIVSNGKRTVGEPSHMEGKIVGGSPVSMDRFPSLVQLYNQGNMCAGNIVHSWAILTAAHCFDLNLDVEEIVVQAGSRFVYDFNADTYAAQSVVIHHRYNETRNYACDIALVFLEKPLRFTMNSKKGILANNAKWMNRRESNFSVTGWGLTKYGGELSNEGLMMTHLRFIPIKQCAHLHHLMLTKDMFCLYGEGTRDTCKGDSGGGVIWKEMIVGLTSHGDGCATKHKPSVYSNVYYFREWIKYNIQKFIRNYCKTTETRRDRYDDEMLFLK